MLIPSLITATALATTTALTGSAVPSTVHVEESDDGRESELDLFGNFVHDPDEPLRLKYVDEKLMKEAKGGVQFFTDSTSLWFWLKEGSIEPTSGYSKQYVWHLDELLDSTGSSHGYHITLYKNPSDNHCIYTYKPLATSYYWDIKNQIKTIEEQYSNDLQIESFLQMHRKSCDSVYVYGLEVTDHDFIDHFGGGSNR